MRSLVVLSKLPFSVSTSSGKGFIIGNEELEPTMDDVAATSAFTPAGELHEAT